MTHYRKTRKIDIDRIISEGEHEALNTGLALKSERVKKLKALALRLERDIFGDDDQDYIWTDQVKGIGSGDIAEIVEYEEFNRAEIEAYRGVLDDIAKELGGRIQRTDLTSKGEKIGEGIGDERLNQSILTLADAIREIVSGPAAEGAGAMDAGQEQAAVVSPPVEGG